MIKAFSLLEFVFIILILGIVFNLGSLYLKKDNLLEGAIQILNDIQYTQSLAMMQEGIRVDELAIAKREWFKSKWQIYFIKSAATGYDQTYTIFLDKNGDGNANLGKTEINIDREIAVDVINLIAVDWLKYHCDTLLLSIVTESVGHIKEKLLSFVLITCSD